MSYDNDDPFAGGSKSPSVSWKGVPIGTTVKLVVDEAPKKVQARDYSTGEPAFWENKDGTKSPKMTVVTTGTVDGEPRSVWAPIPSQIFQAIADAQRAAGAKIKPGGVLTVTLTERRVNPDKPRNEPQNIFEVTYADADPFASQAPAQQAPAATAQSAVSAPAAPPAGVPSADAVTALQAKLGNMRKVGLSDAQIADSAPNLGITAIDGSPLTADMVAAILAV